MQKGVRVLRVVMAVGVWESCKVQETQFLPESEEVARIAYMPAWLLTQVASSILS